MRRPILGAALLCAFALSANAGAEGRVAPSAAEVRPIEVGTTLPQVSLRTPEGEAVALADVTGKGLIALVFYRGGW